MKMIKFLFLATLGATLTVLASGATAGPVALVENVTGNSAGVEFMDYVEAGKVIRLARQDTIVLSYLKSCVRETVTGGTITVGTEKSDVQSGKVERSTVACDAGRMMLASEQANQAAGMVFRGLTSKPQFMLYGASPIVELKGGGTLIIERLNKVGERYVLDIGRDSRGDRYDFADSGKALAAGGVYRAEVAKTQVIFGIDSMAKPGRTPIVGRLVRLTN